MRSWRATHGQGTRRRLWRGATHVVAAVVIAAGFIACMGRAVAWASSVHLPECVVTTEVLPDGKLQYLLQPRCGKLITPALAGSPKWQTAPFSALAELSIPPEGEAARLFFHADAVALDAVGSQPTGGYVLLAGEGQRYSFRLSGDTVGMQDRIMEIASVDDYTATLHFWPDRRTTTLPIGEPVPVNVTYDDAAADMKLTLIQLNADGTMLLRVQFIPVTTTMINAGQGADSVLANVTLAVIFVIGIQLYVYGWLLRKRGRPSADWWILHSHDPRP